MLWTEFCEMTARAGTTRREAVAALARRYSRPARDVYSAIERARNAHAREP
jgi:hypothetical protein